MNLNTTLELTVISPMDGVTFTFDRLSEAPWVVAQITVRGTVNLSIPLEHLAIGVVITNLPSRDDVVVTIDFPGIPLNSCRPTSWQGDIGNWEAPAFKVPPTSYGKQTMTIVAVLGQLRFMQTLSVILEDPFPPVLQIDPVPTSIYIPCPLPPAPLLGANVVVTGTTKLPGTEGGGPSGVQGVEWSLNNGENWNQAHKASSTWEKWSTGDDTTANAIRLTSLGQYTIALRGINGMGVASPIQTVAVEGKPYIRLMIHKDATTAILVPSGEAQGSVTLTGTVSSQFPLDRIEWSTDDPPTVFTSFAPPQGIDWSVAIPGIHAFDSNHNMRTDKQKITIRAIDTAPQANFTMEAVELSFEQEL